MIIISDKKEIKPVLFPKTTTDTISSVTFNLHSELTQQDYNIEVENQGTSKNYYRLLINFNSVADGEYNYTIAGQDKGIIRIGEITADTNTTYYEPIDEPTIFQYGLSSPTTSGSPQPVVVSYLQFTITSDGYVRWGCGANRTPKTIDYNINGGEWVSLTSSQQGEFINVSEGDIIQFKGDNDTYYGSTFSGTSAGFTIEGNIMSLLNGEDYKSATTLTQPRCFYHLFEFCSGLTSAAELLLPATTLTEGCYKAMFVNDKYLHFAPALPAMEMKSNCYGSMFFGCQLLSNAPELPATTLAEECYYQMFYDCVGMINAPSILPATALARRCYFCMFTNCSTIVTAPILPAAVLVEECYYEMFRLCGNLKYIKCLANDISATACTTNWVYYVDIDGLFVKDPTMSGWSEGNNGIPTGWRVENNEII